ncbi:hypothetical protein ACUNG4_12990, partial [Serratia sp. IR-2025]
PPAHSPEENMVRQKCSGIRRSYLEALLISLIVPATALPIDLTAGLTGGMLAKMSQRNQRVTVILNYISGAALLLIGILLLYKNFMGG